ncbi:acid phosphatase [Dendrothele bispora CBS 962.96]|uniref:Acid phosphatase n=1 Tax=Dendrothele bispora (strain CBS 962.96) TaxID=1314807 RepID=A0A4S8MIY2_DENBC|nr:acid phosphatase [Dendrothele bispora CBS 962.96]
MIAVTLAILYLTLSTKGQNIVLTNDDGWATAMIRAQFSSLEDAGYEVILSAPAENQSGSGSQSATPQPLTEPCQFDTCPTGSPAEGSDANDPRINYVNSFPVDAVRFGIQTLSPQLFGGPPEFVVSGPNIGNNLAIISGSGTVGAASEAALEGIPSVAFSGSSDSLDSVSFTTLTSDPNSTDSIAAGIYAALSTKFVNTLLSSSARPILPADTSINVNYPAIDDCDSPDDFKFVLTRLLPNLGQQDDVETCGTDRLPWELTTVARPGCFATVSVFDARTKLDVNAATQQAVLDRVGSLLSCLP